ncbi:ribonuclease P protein component [Cyclobacterium qasimii]|uniref:ribonuclease P protein component n=1 Tax=Cyclobacterium qasimii TaxID=1350429 RepID=UPI0029343F93|nr:ribonuclease P protein component [Cyclobacterium qasimii]
MGISDNQLLVSVSKKKLKNATDRNYIKRRVKEAYRLNKHLLPSTQGSKKLIALIYVSNDLMGYHDISPKVIKVLRKVPVAKPPQE